MIISVSNICSSAYKYLTLLDLSLLWLAEWEYDKSLGYYFNAATKDCYDPNSGLYYSDMLGIIVYQKHVVFDCHNTRYMNYTQCS